MVKTRNKKTAFFPSRWFPLICLAILSSQTCYGEESPNDSRLRRVSSGTAAPEGRFPYVCSIRKRGNRDHVCGGMLVASKWVLTAAHCVDPAIVHSTGRSPLFYCGIHRRQERDEAKTYSTTRCYLHHSWTGNTLNGDDIALCELDKASSSAIPDLATAGDAFGRFDRFAVLGWGRTATSPQYAEELRIGSGLRFVPDSTCNIVEDWKNQIKNSMICAGFNDPDTCRGDSGGPLLVPDEDQGIASGDPSRDLIVGITSFGDNSCDELTPGVYTRVSCYRSWINCIIGGTGEDCNVHVPCEEPPFGCSGAARSGRFNKTAAIETFETAIETDDAATVERVICEGLNPNTTISLFLLSETLLEIATRNDAIESAKVLLRYGAAVEGDYAGSLGLFLRLNFNTPLHYAARHGSAGVAEVLIENGANINAIALFSGYTPLMRAVIEKNLNVVQVLLRNGADLQIKASNRYAALHFAARYNVPEISKALIDAGADIANAIPQKPLPPPPSPSPLLLSNFTLSTFSFLRLPLFFSAYSTNVDDEDDGGWTSLHVTARYDSSEVTKVLLDAGAKLEGKTYRGSSPLHIAAMSDANDVAKILIDRGADINSEDRSDWTPLHFAAQNNSLTTAKDLEAAGAKKEVRSTTGYDPLMVASYHGSLSVVEFLLDEFVTSNSANDAGDTPLHLAASRGHISVVKALLDDGASKLRTDNGGKTPFDEICSRPSGSECTSQTKSTLQGLLRTN